MAINPSLLISAAMLQDVLIDDVTGLPMADGTITLYHDNSRTTLKNWYQQTGTPGAYTYTPLPNPATLTSAGTIADANGNDVIPFYYPYSETDNKSPDPYYIVVVNSNGQSQFTRSNFPFVPPANAANVGVPTNKNIIVNSVFWRNAGTAVNVTTPSQTIAITTPTGSANYLYQTIAPSQHEAFSMPDIIYFKNVAGATDTINFNVIPQIAGQDQIFVNDITPEYLLNFQCSAATTGETVKCIQIPISLHVKTLSGVSCSIVIEAQNVNSSPNNNISIAVFQFLGTGATSTFPTPIQTLTLNSTWTKYIVPFTFPASSTNIGSGGDDALYLQIGFPLNAICNVNIAKPSIYLSNTIPTNDTQTYDEVNAVTSSPRTGDIRTSLNSFQPFGWVPMNDGTIGNSSSNATARKAQDTWPLFNLLWTLFQPFTSGTTNLLAQMTNSSNVNVAYGASAIADFTANNQLALTKAMGKVLLGAAPQSVLLATNKNTFTASNSAGNLLITPSSSMNLFSGMPIQFTAGTGGTLPTGISANTIYYVSNFNSASSTFLVSTTFANALSSTVIAFTNTGTPPNNVIANNTGTFEGEYAHTQLIAELAQHNHPPLSPGTNFLVTGGGSSSVGGGGTNSQQLTTGNTGSSTPFNVTQPGVFMNFFIKL